jgi:hypothetical protein
VLLPSRLLAGLVLAGSVPLEAAAQGRLRPPDFVTCDRNQLTAFTGRVVSLVRGKDTTTLRMETDDGTKERIVLRHPGQDVGAWFYRDGRPFTAADWAVLQPEGRLRPGARATAWVCAAEPNPKVDWEVPS